MQAELPFRPHGGKRKGAGRPSKQTLSSESHAAREKITRHTPVHVTLRVVTLSSSLRRRPMYQAIRKATATAALKQAIRIVHLSIQSNHVHLLIEADDKTALARGMQGFQISAAKHINRALGRKGQVFGDRYNAHVLRTPREAKNATRYVLNNFRKHGATGTAMLDPYATGGSFPSWREQIWEPKTYDDGALWIWGAQSWLLRTVDELSVFDVPGD